MELLIELLEQCELLLDPIFEKDVTNLIEWICRLVNGSQAEVSMLALQLLNNEYVLTNFVASSKQRLHIVEQCLNRNRKDVNEILVQIFIGTSLFVKWGMP